MATAQAAVATTPASSHSWKDGDSLRKRTRSPDRSSNSRSRNSLAHRAAGNEAKRRKRSAPRSPITDATRSEEHTSELQSLMRISYAVFCLKKKKTNKQPQPS